MLFAVSCALGAGDGALTALVSATLQVWWRDDVACSNAAMRSMVALGTAAVAGAGTVVPVGTQVAALGAVFCVACALLARAHARKSIDADEGREGKEFV